MESRIQNYAYQQLEYARKLRSHQDLLRFAIPAAYLTFLSATAHIIEKSGNISYYLYLLSAFVGTGVFVATVSEQYFYVAFRNWERRIESAIFEPSVPQVNQNDGDLVHPCSSNKSEKCIIDGKLQELKDVISFSRARERYGDISKPNIAHVTVTIFLLWIAIFTSIQYSLFVKSTIPQLNVYAITSIVLLLTVLHMSIYKRWHSFYYSIIAPMLGSFKTV